MDVNSLLAAEHGVASWATLRKAGVTRTDLRHAVRDGGLRLLRRGWYATATADATVESAVKAGGVCSCVSALKLHGVWIPEGYGRTHLRARPEAHNQKMPGLCLRHGRPLREGRAVDDVPTALTHAVRCLDPEGIVVVLDSIMNLGLMSRDALEWTLRTTPKSIQRLLDRCAAAESGTETMVRLRLRRHNLPIRTQVQIPGIGRVDLLVGKRLIIEVDGQEHHHSTEQFHNDRERDLEAFRLGYLPMRLAYRHVVHEWEVRKGAILAVVRRGEHLAALPTAELNSVPEPEFP
ncbi:type IV toxin-antitoxin system AbiEi family antitoxin domain-containing protein [Gordonia caeni]